MSSTRPRDLCVANLSKFGLGSRTCIGRHISMLEMCKLVPRLVRDFDLELCDTKRWQTKDHWFVKPENFRMRVRPRRVAGINE